MPPTSSSRDPSAGLICVDQGTTHTRVWNLDASGNVHAHAKAQAGVRDTARDGHATLLRTTLRDLINQVRAAAPQCKPAQVIAAGMITSPLGLLEIPHIPAPAGLDELSTATRAHRFPDIAELPFHLVPGVRSSSGDPAHDPSESDLMRGEETLCIGLISNGTISQETTVLNLGSHWKAIKLSAKGGIESSRTTLSGELMHAAITTTILASAMPPHRPDKLDIDWVMKGLAEQRRSGLTRALFCVRLFQLAGTASPEQLFAYFAGAFIANDLDSSIASGAIQRYSPVIIIGHTGLAGAWSHVLRQQNIASSTLSEPEAESAMLTGLRAVLSRSVR